MWSPAKAVAAVTAVVAAARLGGQALQVLVAQMVLQEQRGPPA